MVFRLLIVFRFSHQLPLFFIKLLTLPFFLVYWYEKIPSKSPHPPFSKGGRGGIIFIPLCADLSACGFHQKKGMVPKWQPCLLKTYLLKTLNLSVCLCRTNARRLLTPICPPTLNTFYENYKRYHYACQGKIHICKHPKFRLMQQGT
jgi:hypothetical protein